MPYDEDDEAPYEISLEDSVKYQLPGYTVNVLLARGDVDGARVELERLLLEGLDSGDPIEVTPQFWADLREELHREALVNAPRKSA